MRGWVRKWSGVIVLAIIFDRLALHFNHIFNSNTGQAHTLRRLIRNGVVKADFQLPADDCERIKKALDSRLIYATRVDNDLRVFGFQHFETAAANLLLENTEVQAVVRAYLGTNYKLQTVLAARIESCPGAQHGSGGGAHRDSFAQQLKVMVYLDDVDAATGPFQYLESSHTVWGVLSSILYHGFSNRIPTTKCQEINSKVKTMAASRGSIIFADTRGIHRGKPIERGVRYALTGYFVANRYYYPQGSACLEDSKAMQVARVVSD